MTDPVNRPVRLAGLAGVVAVGLVLAGCSGDGGEGESSSAAPSATEVSTGSASPTGTGSDSASPSSSASGSYEPATETSPAKNVPVPEIPEAAKEPTEDGLEATLEYWWSTANYLQMTGDSKPIEGVSSSDCELCQRLIDRWSEIYELGGWAIAGKPELQMQFTRIESEAARGTTSFLLTEPSGKLYKPDGSLAEEAANQGIKDQPWTALLVFDEMKQAWVVDDIGIQE